MYLTKAFFTEKLYVFSKSSPKELLVSLLICCLYHVLRSKCNSFTWCFIQLLGISGLPRSLSTLSFMLSTQGCSRTFEPNGGS